MESTPHTLLTESGERHRRTGSGPRLPAGPGGRPRYATDAGGRAALLRSPIGRSRQAWRVKHAARSRPWSPPRSAFAGFRFPAEVIVVAVRGYLRYGLSYRDVEELLAERGIEVDHVTVYRWVQRFTPCWLTPPGSPATHPATAGMSKRHTSRSTACGATCTGSSTSTVRSAGNRNPANAERGGDQGRDRAACFTGQASPPGSSDR